MKINEFNTIANKVSLASINFDDECSCFDKKFCFEYKGQAFETLEIISHDFRAILGDDDYDYVEDESLINELKEYCRSTKI